MSKALKLAIEQNDAELTRQAVQKIKDINRKLPGADKPLLYACKLGSANVVDILVQAGAEGETRGDFPFSAFCVAAEKGQVAVLERLAALGQASPKAVDWAFNNALHDGITNAVRFILECYKFPITANVFSRAASSKKEDLVRLLLELGGDINATDDQSRPPGQTALHHIVHGEPEMVRLFIRCGAKVNARDSVGRTPLLVLAKELEWKERSESPEAALQAVQTLLECGSDATLTDNFGNDAIAYYEWECRRSRAVPSAKILALLDKAGAPGSSVTGRLFAALWEKDPAEVTAAIRAGADVNHVGPAPHGGTPLFLAGDSEEVLESLLTNGADPNKPAHGCLPLVSAARSGKLNVVKRLLAAGANLHATESTNKEEELPWNAYRAADVAGRLEVLDYLKSLGACNPKPARIAAFQAGVASWNDFTELLVKTEVKAVADALARLIQGRATSGVYGQTLASGNKAYVLAQPKGMPWTNVFQVAPPPTRFRDSEELTRLALQLAEAAGAPTCVIEYSDTSDAASVTRFDADGKVTRDQGWDRDSLEEFVGAMGRTAPAWAKKRLATIAPDAPSSTERLQMLAHQEQFVVAAFSFFGRPGRGVDVEVAGYGAEAFEDVAFVSD
jgi:ankyrin repeat protein